jgi:hypothetical protein
MATCRRHNKRRFPRRTVKPLSAKEREARLYAITNRGRATQEQMMNPYNQGNGGNISVASGGGQTIIMPPPYNAQAPQNRATVSAALDGQQQIVIGLHTIISDLETRLTTALDPSTASGAGASSPAPTPTSVINRIADHTRGLEAAAERIADLVQRINL